ncbi:GGDEF domain-containing protein [Edaphobacter aggregans]|uniref:GGDEF domain-containing protein n=1 Tax=Edaphobacter aggregans TaxID=570835 RepID=UPI000AFC1482|nr:GGDEF domain-containing protein [Edaphobacter aggregans]
MNIQLLPDLAAMATLLTILYFLRRRHLQEGVGLWIVGLVFIFLEAIAHFLYMPSGPRHLPMHVVALDSYLAAGAIFLLAAARGLFPQRLTLIYLLVNTAPLAAIETIYGLDLRNRALYHLVAACGLALGLVTPFFLCSTVRLRKAWWLVLVQAAIWIPVWSFASNQMFRDTAYYSLFVMYLTAAVVFQLSLPKKSLGKISIVAGFTLWSLVFLAHSWVSNNPQYVGVAAAVWDWQKFLVTIGMLLVMLERQVSCNEWNALHDQLTGLPNRRLFEDRLEQALEHSRRNGTRTALTMIDLNGFKSINDQQGHDTGDRLLEHIANNLRHAVRSPDTLARLGGDEFIIIATDLPSEMPASLLVEASTARVRDALKKPLQVGGRSLSVSGSVGVAIFPDDTTDEVLLRRLADQRMYQQKRQIPLPLGDAASLGF